MPKTLFVGSTKAGQTRVEDSPFYGTIPNPSVQKEGILSVAVADDGAITPGAFFPLDTHIGWIERHPTNGLIYAAGGGRLFSLKEANGTLHRLTTAETIGDPCHFTISADGKWALAASYGGGTLCVIPILADGILGAATDSKLHSADWLKESLADRQESCHPHQIKLDPTGQWALSCDLGADRVWVYAFDGANLPRNFARNSSARNSPARNSSARNSPANLADSSSPPPQAPAARSSAPPTPTATSLWRRAPARATSRGTRRASGPSSSASSTGTSSRAAGTAPPAASRRRRRSSRSPTA